jgi:hypothetical protein
VAMLFFSGGEWDKSYSERKVLNTGRIKWKIMRRRWVFFFHQFGGK